MEPEELREQIREFAEKRANLLREASELTDFLKEDIAAAIGLGILSEQGAHKLTGISRNTIRTWLGKT